MNLYALTFSSPLAEHDFEMLRDFVSERRRTAAENFRIRSDAERALLGEALLRYVLIDRHRLDPQSLEFAANQYGKPVLPAGRPYFNISHSHEWVVCAIDDRPVGIDVELVREIDIEIAHRFFSPEEYAAIARLDAGEREGAFFDYWTLKESFIKAIGKGLSHPLNAFTVRSNGGDSWRICDELSHEWRLRQYRLEQGYRCAVCGDCECFPETFDRITPDDLIGFVKGSAHGR